MADKPNPQPLAALLASHPDECADAVAFLAIRTPHIGVSPREAKAEGLVDILDALCAAGLAVRGERSYWLASDGESRAIARMGAAAWLAARSRPPLDASPRERELRSSARLFVLAAEVWASPIPEPRKTDVRWFVRSALPESARRYRDALEDLAVMGERAIDVDAEVAAVWGAQP